MDLQQSLKTGAFVTEIRSCPKVSLSFSLCLSLCSLSMNVRLPGQIPRAVPWRFQGSTGYPVDRRIRSRLGQDCRMANIYPCNVHPVSGLDSTILAEYCSILGRISGWLGFGPANFGRILQYSFEMNYQAYYISYIISIPTSYYVCLFLIFFWRFFLL